MKKILIIFFAAVLMLSLAACGDNGEQSGEYYREVDTTENTVKVVDNGTEIVRTITGLTMTEITTFKMDGDTIVGAVQERIFVKTEDAQLNLDIINSSFGEAEIAQISASVNGNVLTLNLLGSDYNPYNVFATKAELVTFLSEQYSDFGYTVVE